MRLRTLVAFGAGAAAAYLLDPASGRGRRQALGDRIEHLSTTVKARSRGPGGGHGAGPRSGFGSRPGYGEVPATSEFDDATAGRPMADGRSDVGVEDAAPTRSPGGAGTGRRGTPTDPLLEPVTPAIR